MILISYRNLYFFTIYISPNMAIFFLDHNKLHKKQKFSVFDAIE